jgi:hypothetical protein
MDAELVTGYSSLALQVTGDVINMRLLQFQLREFAVQQQQFTGHLATFSNSLVFVSPATGLLRFDSAHEFCCRDENNPHNGRPRANGA